MVAEGRRRMVHEDEMGGLRKGPWKSEEDEVLLNHVKRYGPRDWSSIRSKGLLQRTGKSCRLRWVNKLRPNLKNGVKFSAEEERTVIELQAQFGNKWAKIATYLTGRTDNDVKNFWSSRQKRLARILQNSAQSSSSSSKSVKNTREVIKLPSFHNPPSHDQAHKLTKSQSCSSSHISNSLTIKFPSFLDPPSHDQAHNKLTKSQSCSSSHISNSLTIKMPFMVYPNIQCYEQNPFHQIETKPLMMEPQCNDDDDLIPFRCIPQLQPCDFSVALESQGQFIGETNFMDVFGQSSSAPAFVGPNGDQLLLGPVKRETSDCADNMMITPPDDSFMMDDLPPIDTFDHLDPLPSPSEWS